jgi:hypothetical protein
MQRYDRKIRHKEKFYKITQLFLMIVVKRYDSWNRESTNEKKLRCRRKIERKFTRKTCLCETDVEFYVDFYILCYAFLTAIQEDKSVLIL